MKWKYPGYCLIIFSIIFYTNTAKAQSAINAVQDVNGKFEASITLAANNFLGDLGGNIGVGGTFLKDYTFKTIKPLAGASIAYYPANWCQVKFGFNFTAVDGADSLIKPTNDEARWRIYRNLSFKSSIFEAYAGADFYPVTFFSRSYTMHRLAPYLGVGIGIFHFNPQAQLNGQWINLRPLHLEGQGWDKYANRKLYSLWQPYIPVTIGAKWFINDQFSLSGGMLMRKTFTDYIDDISTTYIDPALFDQNLSPDQAAIAKQLYERSLHPEKVKPDIAKANPSNNDTYLSFFLTFSISFNQPHGTTFNYGVR